MQPAVWIRSLFVVAGTYDVVLGLIFCLGAPRAFQVAGFEPATQWQYIRFAAALLVIFGIMFFAIAGDPMGNRRMIPYGILLKLTFCTFVVYYSIATKNQISRVWQACGGFDLIFLALFYIAMSKLNAAARAQLAPKAA